MLKKLIFILLLLLLPLAALAETAQDISDECIINGKEINLRHPDELRDESYRTYYVGKSMSIVAPESRTIAGVQLKWRTINMPGVRVLGGQGDVFTEICQDGPRYAVQYIALDAPQQELRIEALEGKLEVCEVTVLSPGEPPANIHRWRDPPEKVDLMLFSTHPDDEVLWFGGLLPLYAGEMGKNVLVVNASYNEYLRRLELLDALWACGVDLYPVMLCYPDVNNGLMENLEVWSQRYRDPKNRTVEVLRQYKPDVLVLHDINGEYGHSAHKTFSYLGRQAVERAGNAQEHPASAEKWGVWEVPKTYIHYYAENRIQMDWTQPLAAFDGKTALEVATLALDFHISQRNRGWSMTKTVQYDNSIFGLWRTTVGPDVEKNDMFENIPAN